MDRTVIVWGAPTDVTHFVVYTLYDWFDHVLQHITDYKMGIRARPPPEYCQILICTE